MARTTKPLSGAGKDKFLRTLVAGVEGVPDAAADAVTSALVSTITEVRVRRDAWEAQARAEPPVRRGRRSAAPAPAQTDATAPVAATSAPVPSGAVPSGPVPSATGASPAETSVPPMAATETFDPFAFSVVATLTKKGKAGLMDALARITSADQLKRMAEAQHLSVDPALDDVEALRAAIHDGAARRIAERRAAAR